MSLLVPLLEALVRSAGEEMVLIPGEKIFVQRRGQRLELGREALSAAAVEGVAAEVMGANARPEAAATVPWKNSGEEFAIEISRISSGAAIRIRRVAPPVPASAPPEPLSTTGPPLKARSPNPAAAAVSATANPIDEMLSAMVSRGASDLHLTSGSVPIIRVDGEMTSLGNQAVFTSDSVRALIEPILNEKARSDFEATSDADFAYEIPNLARFRVNVFRDRAGAGAVFRQIPFEIVAVEELAIPKAVLDLCFLTKGLVLVTGPTGSGKSTTLAALLNYINRHRADHIVTIEDPIEFVHSNIKCLVNQREVGQHTKCFKNALRAALREDPDIVLVGEMRDLETIAIAIETAETGHLVFGTLHTTTAISTVDRIIDQFPTDQQEQIRVDAERCRSKASSRRSCASRIGGGRVAAMEILLSESRRLEPDPRGQDVPDRVGHADVEGGRHGHDERLALRARADRSSSNRRKPGSRPSTRAASWECSRTPVFRRRSREPSLMPARLISLCPSLTETLAEMGLGGRLVGVTRYCTRPRELVRSLTKVGGTKTIDFPAIERLAPDAVFANAEENRKEDVEALAGRFRVHVSLPRSVAEVAPHVRELALQAGEPGAGDAMADEIESSRRRREEDFEPRFRYAYFIWKDPWMSISGDTYVSDLFRYAGGVNVFAGAASRYPEVTPADVLAARPDVLFFASEPFPFSAKHLPAIAAEFGTSVPVELVDGDDCCWHGARTRQGLKLMGELRERFGEGASPSPGGRGSG